MPFYEYRCDSCGHTFDALQKFSDEPLQLCPACKKPDLRKLISASGFRLKGEGWYETDFKSANKRNLVDSSPTSPKADMSAAATPPAGDA